MPALRHCDPDLFVKPTYSAFDWVAFSLSESYNGNIRLVSTFTEKVLIEWSVLTITTNYQIRARQNQPTMGAQHATQININFIN